MYRDPKSYATPATGYGNSRAPRQSYSDPNRTPVHHPGGGAPQQQFTPAMGQGPVREWRDGLRRSLFKSADDLRDIQRTLLAVLEGNMRHLDWLQADKEGMFSVADVLKALHDENRDLGYVGYGHLVEVFLRDGNGDLVLTDTKVGIVSQAIVEPPELLYFGTTSAVADRAVRRGIMSGSKPMVTLHTTLEAAMDAGKHFANYKGDQAVVLAVTAREAYLDGTDFAPSGTPNTLLCKFVSQRYIESLHRADGTVEHSEGGGQNG